ncbi:hypothetical protein BGW80DRAFT_1516824 [Lactifluus volemus]|nr:hypothetical protein BGW80DRAFT_1516824 [Lactifluus volemus]
MPHIWSSSILSASYSGLSAFFNERHQVATDANKLPRDGPSRNDLFDNSKPLVLTHQDLNLSKSHRWKTWSTFGSLTGNGQDIIHRGLSMWRCGGRMRMTRLVE